MTQSPFFIALFGFSPIDRALVTSLCKLSEHRAAQAAGEQLPSFRIFDGIGSNAIDIVLVNADDAAALPASQNVLGERADVPVISVSKNPKQAEKPGQLTLARHRLGGMLLKTLDQLVQQTRQSETPSPAVHSAGPKTCLVVDDSQLVRTQMELVLSDFGLQAAFAESAEQALAMIAQQTFDLIFLDVMLPEMDGYKACKRIKSNPSTSTTPVVMLTSKSSPFNKMHGALVGCDSYLTKPVDSGRIHKVLKAYELLRPGTDGLEPRLVPV